MKAKLARIAWTLGCLLTLLLCYVHAQTGEMSVLDVRPVAVNNGAIELTPENTMIEFVGTHVGDDPKPRVGGFKKFEGQVLLANQDTAIKSLNLKIDITSVWTEFPGLTKHLKSADFFESNRFGMSEFKSTQIGNDDTGATTITGELSLHGQTREVTFPAKVKLSDKGLMMKCEFNLDRTLFGMNKMTSGVEKMVALRMVVGQKPETRNVKSGLGNDDKKSSGKRSVNRSTYVASRSVSISVPNMM